MWFDHPTVQFNTVAGFECEELFCWHIKFCQSLLEAVVVNKSLNDNTFIVGDNGNAIVDPIGPKEVSKGETRSPRVARGGSIDDTLSWCASHIRTRLGATDSWAPIYYGFRVVAPMGGKW